MPCHAMLPFLMFVCEKAEDTEHGGKNVFLSLGRSSTEIRLIIAFLECVKIKWMVLHILLWSSLSIISENS